MNKNSYRLIVFRETYEDRSFEFVAKYPEIDAVIGVGDSYEEAIKEAEEAKEAYFSYLKEQGKPLPKPLDTESLSGRVTLRMSKTLHRKVIERAEMEKISINHLINEAVNEYISRENTVANLSYQIGKTID